MRSQEQIRIYKILGIYGYLIPPVAQPKQVATLIMISRRAMTFVRGAKIRRSPLFCRLALYLIELCSPLVYL